MPVRDSASNASWLSVALDRRDSEEATEFDAPIAPFNSAL
jgi:hypothetical protein